MKREAPTVTRREFAKVGLSALGAAMVCPTLMASERSALPTVRWRGHELSPLLLGHNPFKGMAHQPGELGREMKAWFESDPSRGLALMRRCEELGVTAFQMGFRPNERIVERLVRDPNAEGGRFKWEKLCPARPT